MLKISLELWWMWWCNLGAKSLRDEKMAHSGGTETKVKEIVSDVPPHTNQNIGIF